MKERKPAKTDEGIPEGEFRAETYRGRKEEEHFKGEFGVKVPLSSVDSEHQRSVQS